MRCQYDHTRSKECCNMLSPGQILFFLSLSVVHNTLLKSNVTGRDLGGRCRGSQECGSRFVNFACKFHTGWHAVFGSSHNSEIYNIGARAQ